MSGLLFLNTADFSIKPGTKGSILCTNIPGFSLILFYSTQCVHCQGLIPIFKRLPGSISGCQFGMINVSQNKEVILKCQNTIAPITYVPYIILYINGKPFMRYDGNQDENEIKKFIIDISSRINNKQQFSTSQNNNNDNTNKDKEIPAYSLGVPITGEVGNDNVCYLEFVSAYKN